MRAIYAIMGCYKRYKVKAHFWEVERRFANVRTMADYGKSVDWPTPPAALSQFHNITVMLHRRSDPTKRNSNTVKHNMFYFINTIGNVKNENESVLNEELKRHLNALKE